MSLSEIAKKIKAKGVGSLSLAHSEAVRMLNRVLTHSESEDFPEHLFKAKAPNETEAQIIYRNATYKPITHREWAKSESKFNRVFNSQNYSIDWVEIEAAQWKDEQPDDYFSTDFPEYGSIVNYFQSVVKHNKIIDPNAVIAIRPNVIPRKESRDEEGNPIMVVDQSQSISPVFDIYRSNQVVEKTDRRLLVLSDETVVLDSKANIKGMVFYEWTDEYYLRYYQVGKQFEYKFEQEILWEHGVGELPAQKLKGKIIDYKGTKVYKSIFYEAVNYLDTALYNWSTLQASIVDNVYLERWEYVDECDAQGCIGGKVQTDDGVADCPSCKGSGNKNVGGIFSSYKLRKPSPTQDGIDPPPFGYVTKNPEILRFLEDHVEKNIKDAFAFITVEDEAVGNETATGRYIDREDLFSFMLDFSTEIFTLLEWAIDIAGKMRYGDHWQMPIINYPTEFSFKNSYDIIRELETSTKIPSIAKHQVLSEFIAKKFEGSPKMKRVAELWLQIDRLASKSDEYIQLNLNRTISKWEAVLHDSFIYIYEQVARDNNIDEQTEVDTIRELMRAKAKEITEGVAERRLDPDLLIGNDT